MARLPFVIDDPDYHSKFEQFAYDAAAELADTLLDRKISKERAHEIVGDFLFRFAMMFDDGGAYRTKKIYRPKLAFLSSTGELVVPTQGTYLHETAFDIVEAVFNVQGRR